MKTLDLLLLAGPMGFAGGLVGAWIFRVLEVSPP